MLVIPRSITKIQKSARAVCSYYSSYDCVSYLVLPPNHSMSISVTCMAIAIHTYIHTDVIAKMPGIVLGNSGHGMGYTCTSCDHKHCLSLSLLYSKLS